MGRSIHDPPPAAIPQDQSFPDATGTFSVKRPETLDSEFNNVAVRLLVQEYRRRYKNLPSVAEHPVEETVEYFKTYIDSIFSRDAQNTKLGKEEVKQRSRRRQRKQAVRRRRL